MRIISKKKDYYDYLINTYGIDNSIIFKRNGLVDHRFISEYGVVKIHFCDKCYIGVKYKDVFYFLNDIFKIPNSNNFKTNENNNDYSKWYYDFKINKIGRIWDNYRIKTMDSTINEKLESPIVVEYNKQYYKNCNLSIFNFGSAIEPKVAYELIYNWISEQKTKKENIIDNRTDIQKIESFGFDKKTSFRNIN